MTGAPTVTESLCISAFGLISTSGPFVGECGGQKVSAEGECGGECAEQLEMRTIRNENN